MSKLCFEDLQMLSERDRLYSLAISPIALSLASSIVMFFVIGFGPMLVLLSAAIALVVTLTHVLLGWMNYSSNWKYYYKAYLGGSKYHIVKDGARRIRVIRDDGITLEDLRTGQIYMDRNLKDWLSTTDPTLGTIDQYSASISM